MPLGTICVHTATPVTEVESDDEATWAAGEPEKTVTTGEAFPCVLFLPLGKREDTRGRQVREPTLLWEAFNEEGEPMVPVKENDELLILAEELTGADPVRWQVNGEPQPFGPPGEVIGYQATLIRVSDGADVGAA